MTATPIPRTLSLTAYGDLDATSIRELPAGRQPVKTWVVGEEKRAGAYEFIRDRLREGRQAYVVCPLVADSEKLRAKAASVEAERLRTAELAGFRVGLLHGQMSSAEKAAAMEEFVSGRTDVLVATTVIEVGIDVPNATVMLIEGAERFGLSQLHQLRGRVGRGAHESQCILFADLDTQLAKRRMEAIEGSADGFELAEIDLTLRGEGEILGTLQHGLPRYRVAELPEDAELLAAARAEVIALLERHGGLDAPELGPLVDAARARFGDERDRRDRRMRVVAGRLGGRTLKSPPGRSKEIRPTSDRARETLFSILGDVSDLSVLDLFCGTGALAIEAISRGADSAVLVDTATALAERNATELGIANRCEFVRSDAIRYLERTRGALRARLLRPAV